MLGLAQSVAADVDRGDNRQSTQPDADARNEASLFLVCTLEGEKQNEYVSWER